MTTLIAPRMHDLGGFQVRRAVPSLQARSVGPFVFVDHMGPATFDEGRGVDVRPVRNTPPGWAMAQVARSAQAWVTEDSVSMVYESLTAGAATGLLAVPRLGETRITAGVAELQREGFVTTFADWQRDGALHAPPGRLAEADRIAEIVLSRWPR